MTTLTLADIDEEITQRLQWRADRSGRSLEEEALRAISENVANDRPAQPASRGESAWDVIQRIKAEAGGGGDFEPLDRKEWKDRPVDFGE